jgi:hypothetical protein
VLMGLAVKSRMKSYTCMIIDSINAGGGVVWCVVWCGVVWRIGQSSPPAAP